MQTGIGDDMLCLHAAGGGHYNHSVRASAQYHSLPSCSDASDVWFLKRSISWQCCSILRYFYVLQQFFWKVLGKDSDNNGPSSELKSAIGRRRCLSGDW